MQLFRSTSQWAGLIGVLFFVAFEKSLQIAPAFPILQFGLKGRRASSGAFFLPVIFFLIWCGLLFYNLSKCICVNAYSALVSLSMTISLKHLGVHYVHASTWMKMFSLKVEFLKIFLFMSKAVDLLLCNKSSTVEYILVRLHVLILTKSQAGGWELRCVA